MASEFDENYIGIRAFLMTDPDLSAGLEEIALRVYKEADRIAPVGEADDPHAGDYKASLYMEKHVSPSRMSWRVGSTDRKNYWIEYGTKHMPKFAVLRRALASVTGGSSSAADYSGIEEYDAGNKHSALKRMLNRAARTRKSELRRQSGS